MKSQLSRDYPGQLMQSQEGKELWIVKRQDSTEPSCWSESSAGVIRYRDEVHEVYNVEVAERVADHVKTRDETIVPGHLSKKDKNELK